jgi:hypothetical protein
MMTNGVRGANTCRIATLRFMPLDMVAMGRSMSMSNTLAKGEHVFVDGRSAKIAQEANQLSPRSCSRTAR